MRKMLRKVQNRLLAPVTKQINNRLPARQADSFDVLDAAWANAALESGRYYSEHMLTAMCFPDHDSLREFTVQQRVLAGLVLEFGVASGRSINALARTISPHVIHGFDSFNGLPEDWNAAHRKGAFAQKVPQVERNVELVVGTFASTLPRFLQTHPDAPVSFLHVDCDLYSSTNTVFEHLGPRIKQGTVILFDEYFNYPGWQEHEYKAFHEFVARASIRYRYLGFNRAHQQVSVIIE